MKKLNQYIDHTLLHAYAQPKDIKKLCEEAKNHSFYAVCVNGCYVNLAKEELAGSEVKIASVIGFPLGAMTTETKVAEAEDAIRNGADEIDMVINIGWLKSNALNKVKEDIAAVKKAIGDKVLKVIIETCYLESHEKKAACQAALDAQADFVKTSTGFGTQGATLEDVELMKKVVGDQMKIKASGGIRDQETALKYIDLGVSRIGTSSGIKIIINE